MDFMVVGGRVNTCPVAEERSTVHTRSMVSSKGTSDWTLVVLSAGRIAVSVSPTALDLRRTVHDGEAKSAAAAVLLAVFGLKC